MLNSSTTSTSSLVFPLQSSTLLHSQATLHGFEIPMAPQWADNHAIFGVDMSANPPHLAIPRYQLTKIPTTDDAGSLKGWIKTLGVADAYRPPPERVVKAAACFCVLDQLSFTQGRTA